MTEIKTDCDFFRENDGKGCEYCKVLTELVCRKKKCTFYTKEAEAEDIEKEQANI